MKKIAKIVLFIVFICMLASCASSRRSQVLCPAYSGKSSGFERLPF